MRIFPTLTNRLRWTTLVIFAFGVILAFVLSSVPSFSKTPSTRDKFLWPFAPTSIWNMPIGSKARYVPAKIKKEPYLAPENEYFYKLKEGDPLRPVYAPGAWGEGRCTGKLSMGISLPVPDELIVPDATKEPYYTPNNPSAFLMPDGKTLVQLSPLARCKHGSPVYGHRYPDVDIYGNGIGGSHFGSNLSAIGGSIRKGELTNNKPIRHALKVLLWGGKYLYYSKTIPGKRWPATNADHDAATHYKGKNPDLVQGSLLAILPQATEASLKLKTFPGKKLFHALQDYGAYVVDGANEGTHYIAVEQGVPEELYNIFDYKFKTTSGPFFDDVMQLFQALYIVDNNGPKSIGGGGKRRAPLAPPIGN